MPEGCLPVKYCKGNAMVPLLQPIECWCFDRGTKIILSEFSDKNNLEWGIYIYDKYSLIASLIITLTFHYTLYLIQNQEGLK